MTSDKLMVEAEAEADRVETADAAAEAAAAATLAPAWLQRPREGLGLHGFMRMLRRHRLLIAVVVVSLSGLAALVAWTETPLYRAEADLVLEGSRARISAVEAAVAGPRTTLIADATEAAVIGSRDVAAGVVAKLDLANDPKFAADHAPSGLLTWVEPVIRGLAAATGLAWSEPPQAEATEARRLDAATDAFLAGLEVAPVPGSSVIAIRYLSPDAHFAAQAANAVAEVYLAQQTPNPTAPAATGAAAAPASTGWINARAKALSDTIGQDQQKLAALDRSAPAPAGGLVLYQQQLFQLNDQLGQTRSQIAALQAKVDQSRNGGGTGAEDAATDDPALAALRQQEDQLQHQIAEMRTQYRDNHPKMKQARSDLAAVQAKIQAELARGAKGLAGVLQAAKAREKQLNQDINRITGQLSEQEQAQSARAALQNEIKTNQELYQSLMAGLDERPKGTAATAATPAPMPTARLITRATAPKSPAYPRRGLLIGLSFLVSILIALGLTLIRELFDRGFRTLSELEGATGLQGLGLVPYLPRRLKGKRSPHHRALDEPNSTYGEAIRALRSGLTLGVGRTRPRVIMVTSSIPGEGKTSTALALATSAARAGQRCVLVECDVLRPALAAALGVEPAAGVAEYLAGKADAQEIVHLDSASGAQYILAGDNGGGASDMLASAGIEGLVDELRQFYDLVILDSPPVLPVSDALVLQRLVDETLYLVRWRKTPRDIVFAGLRRLAEAGGVLGGVILTLVDVRKHAQFEFGASGENYYSAYRRYHTDAA